MKYLKLLAIIGSFIIGIITSGETNSLQVQEVWFHLKEVSDNINDSSDLENSEKNQESSTTWEFIKANKWYIIIGVAVGGIAVYVYKYLSSESISLDNTLSVDENSTNSDVDENSTNSDVDENSINSDVDENVKNSQTSINSINSQTSINSINSINSQTEEYEEIKTVLMGVPRDLTDLSEENMVKFVVPAFVKPEEFTTANVLLNAFRLDNGMKMFLKYVSIEMYTNFSEEESLRWLNAWEEYHYMKFIKDNF